MQIDRWNYVAKGIIYDIFIDFHKYHNTITFNEIVLGEDMVKTGLFENVLAYCAQQYRKQLLAEQTSTNLQNMLLHPSLFLLVFSASCQLLFDSKNIFFRARSLTRILAFLLQKKMIFQMQNLQHIVTLE